MIFKDILKTAAEEYGVDINEQQLKAYDTYYQLLVEWNNKINLTAITEPQPVAIKHMIDSISCFKPEIFSPGATVIDVGTGAGFPGLPLKIFQPQLQLTLLDSLNKRVKFLQCVVDQLQLTQTTVIHARAEEAARQKLYREKFDIAVSRAVARLPVLCEYCLPFVSVGGYFVALKGMQYQSEAAEAEKAVDILGGRIEEIVPVKLPGIDDVRAVIYIKKIKKTPGTYPRKAGTPEKNPL